MDYGLEPSSLGAVVNESLKEIGMLVGLQLRSGVFFLATLLVVTSGAVQRARAQTPAEAIDIWRMPADAVVAKLDGEPATAGQLVQYLQTVPEQLRPKSVTELKPLIERFGLERRLARNAEAVGLDKQQPYITAVDIARMQMLAKAQLEYLRTKMAISDAEVQAWYTEHKAVYTSASVQIAYIRHEGSGSSSGPAQRTRAQAEAAAARLAAEARAGKPFAQLIDSMSDEHPLVTRTGTSKSFDGTDVLPGELKQAILRGQTGEIVGPFSASGGLFICRILDISVKPFSAVQEQAFSDVREAKVQEWVESQKSTVDIAR